MTDRRVELQRWIQEASASSEPIKLDDILELATTDVDWPPGTDPDTFEPPFADPTQENPMPYKQGAIVFAAAAMIAVIAFVAMNSGERNGDTVTADRTESVTTTSSPDQSTTIEPVATPTELATDYWEALVAGDRDTALGLIDPLAIDDGAVSPHGRAQTLAGQFDWWEAVEWRWELIECVAESDIEAECTAAGSNAWSDALGVDPAIGIFAVRFSEDGIIDVDDKADWFSGQWRARAFNLFAKWVQSNFPEDAEIMFEGDPDVTPEILRLYEMNTGRFVDAQQGQ